MLSQFAYDDTDWAMMSSAPDMESGHYFGTDSSGRDLLVRVAIGGRISLWSVLLRHWWRGRGDTLWFAFRLSGR